MQASTRIHKKEIIIMEITGAELFVKALKEENVTTLFAYPGGQVIDLFDALYGEKEIDNTFEIARQNTKAPTVIEFIIDREINVMPLVPPGNALGNMILEGEKKRE